VHGAAMALLGVVCLLGSGPATGEHVDPWVYAYKGLDHFYNLEYKESQPRSRKPWRATPTIPSCATS